MYQDDTDNVCKNPHSSKLTKIQTVLTKKKQCAMGWFTENYSTHATVVLKQYRVYTVVKQIFIKPACVFAVSESASHTAL